MILRNSKFLGSMTNGETDSISNEESQQIDQDDLNTPKLTKFRRCWKPSERPRGLEGFGFFVPHNDSQFFEQLVRQGKSADTKGGEIFEPKRKNSTSIFSIIKKFLKNFKLRGSTTHKPHSTSSQEEESEDFESTTTDNSPIEVILPVSGPFLKSSTTQIPDDVSYEMPHTFYESSSEDTSTQGQNLERSSESSAPILFGGNHATFDLEIKAIPIVNRPRNVISGIN